jgi:hypothetical protein
VPDVPPIQSPSAGRGAEIFDVLEVPGWAPWLRFSPQQLDAQAEVFPAGQILLCDDDSRPIASLSTNRIDWDGQVEHLPTWDDVAGRSRTYRETHDPRGNAMVLMSVSVRPDQRGSRLPQELIDRARAVAVGNGIEHLLSDFRPSGYGRHKARHGGVGFAEYCSLTRPDGLPVDDWLRSLVRIGMEPLRVDRRAMVLETTVRDLRRFRRIYEPGKWYEVREPRRLDALIDEHAPHNELERVETVWECGETGTWYVDISAARALYIESNLWGQLPL